MDFVKGLLFVKFNEVSTTGWSRLRPTEVDVAKVTNITPRKRMFCLWDRDYPYSLDIKYNEPLEQWSLTMLIGFFDIIPVIHNKCSVEHIITRRYKTKEAMLQDLTVIRKEQQRLDAYLRAVRDTISKLSYTNLQ